MIVSSMLLFARLLCVRWTGFKRRCSQHGHTRPGRVTERLEDWLLILQGPDSVRTIGFENLRHIITQCFQFGIREVALGDGA